MRIFNFQFSVFKKAASGQVLFAVTIFFLAFSLALMLGFAEPILRVTAGAGDLEHSRQAYFTGESLAEDLAYRFMTGKTTVSGEMLAIGSTTATSTIGATFDGEEISATGTDGDFERAVYVALKLGDGVAFHYASQAGRGGFDLQNSSSITGNVYSEGTVKGTGSNVIRGDVVSSGPGGLVYGIHATSSVYAHTIGDASQPTEIDKDAYYATTLANTTVSGASHPNSTDQPTAALPISDAQISDWEAQAQNGGSVTCSGGEYDITASVTLGPKKIPCDLVIKGNNAILDVTGPIWVTGNITTQTGPTIKMDPGLGSQNVAIIADNPDNTTGSGIISINQNTLFQNSGANGSFVFMISQNNSAEEGGGTDAIVLSQGASAMVAYASHGQITLGQSVSIKEVTAYKIILQNTANVVYDTGLPTTLFDSGPSGGYSITDWREVLP